MGDLVGTAVTGKLYFIKQAEFQRVRSFNAPPHEVVSLFADMARLNTLYMIASAGSGHIGSSFSSMDIFAHLQLRHIDPAKGDIFFSSKGHDAPGLYAVLMAVGALFLSRFLAGLLFEVTPFDTLTFALTCASLTLVALAAAWIPARRATRVEPTTALRAT